MKSESKLNQPQNVTVTFKCPMHASKLFLCLFHDMISLLPCQKRACPSVWHKSATHTHTSNRHTPQHTTLCTRTHVGTVRRSRSPHRTSVFLDRRSSAEPTVAAADANATQAERMHRRGGRNCQQNVKICNNRGALCRSTNEHKRRALLLFGRLAVVLQPCVGHKSHNAPTRMNGTPLAD